MDNHCDLIRTVTERVLGKETLDKKDNFDDAVSKVSSALRYSGHSATESLVKGFVKRQFCVAGEKKRVRMCLGKAILQCRKRPLRVLEINRMKMEDMDFLLEAFPDAYVIYYTCDPRAIALSRAQWLFPINKNDRRAIVEARYLCPRMGRDVLELRRLDLKYPGIIHHVRYEDFTTSPTNSSEKIYGYFKRVPPASWKQFAEENMRSQDNEKYRVQNASYTAMRWSKEIPVSELSEIEMLCGVVLDSLGYPRYA